MANADDKIPIAEPVAHHAHGDDDDEDSAIE